MLMLLFVSNVSLAQCPENIDFEKGTFEGWKCYQGSTEADGGQNFIYLTEVPAPIPGKHVMFSTTPGDGLDQYGGFPKNCPNGSGHSIMLGDNDGTAEALGVSYEFTIPATSNKFSIKYNYAVVIQDPGHQSFEQPRMQIEVFNVTDNEVLNCSSFSFVANNSLPGFLLSPNPGGISPVRYKDWSNYTINLDGLQGKTIRFFIKVADCTYEAHFGYAYVDVVAECNSNLQGAIFCNSDTSVDLVAPDGYQTYHWLSNDLSQIISTDQTLHISPLPTPGSTIAIEITPYPGYGCIDTLYQVMDTIQSNADAGPDRFPCNMSPVQLGSNSVPGLIYQWSPNIGLSDDNSPNPFANPDQLVAYELVVSSTQGSCVTKDSVIVNPQIINQNLQVLGSNPFCLGNVDAPILQAAITDSIQWYWNGTLTASNGSAYAPRSTGDYYAVMYSAICTDPVQTNVVRIVADTARVGIRYPEVSIPIQFAQRIEARDFGQYYQWFPSTQLLNAGSMNPYFKGNLSQEYTIEIKTPTGCVTVDTQYVRVFKKIKIYVPTAFTPNNDGQNDYLRPLLLGFEKLISFSVYNRWGRRLYHTTNELPGWDGKVNDLIQEPQTIVWIVEAIDIDGKIQKATGTTLLLP